MTGLHSPGPYSGMTWIWPDPGFIHSYGSGVPHALVTWRSALGWVMSFSMVCKRACCKRMREPCANGAFASPACMGRQIPTAIYCLTGFSSRPWPSSRKQDQGFPLGVQLNGGIGDHIEALSLLLPWAKARNFGLNLEMTAERQQQIEPLLQKWDQIRCNNNLEQRSASIPVMALRAVVASNAEPSQYLPWLTKPQTNKQRERDWLCCWRAEEPETGCQLTADQYL